MRPEPPLRPPTLSRSTDPMLRRTVAVRSRRCPSAARTTPPRALVHTAFPRSRPSRGCAGQTRRLLPDRPVPCDHLPRVHIVPSWVFEPPSCRCVRLSAERASASGCPLSVPLRQGAEARFGSRAAACRAAALPRVAAARQLSFVARAPLPVPTGLNTPAPPSSYSPGCPWGTGLTYHCGHTLHIPFHTLQHPPHAHTHAGGGCWAARRAISSPLHT